MKYNIFMKILCILLPLAVLVLGALPTYEVLFIEINGTEEIRSTYMTSYFDTEIFAQGNFFPMAAMVLTAAALLYGIYCAFRDSEQNIYRLLTMAGLAAAGSLGIVTMQNITLLGWVMIGLMLLEVCLLALVLKKAEDDRKAKTKK